MVSSSFFIWHACGKDYQKYMKDQEFKSFVEKYASDYAKYLKDDGLGSVFFGSRVSTPETSTSAHSQHLTDTKQKPMGPPTSDANRFPRPGRRRDALRSADPSTWTGRRRLPARPGRSRFLLRRFKVGFGWSRGDPEIPWAWNLSACSSARL